MLCFTHKVKISHLSTVEHPPPTAAITNQVCKNKYAYNIHLHVKVKTDHRSGINKEETKHSIECSYQNINHNRVVFGAGG